MASSLKLQQCYSHVLYLMVPSGLVITVEGVVVVTTPETVVPMVVVVVVVPDKTKLRRKAEN